MVIHFRAFNKENLAKYTMPVQFSQNLTSLTKFNIHINTKCFCSSHNFPVFLCHKERKIKFKFIFDNEFKDKINSENNFRIVLVCIPKILNILFHKYFKNRSISLNNKYDIEKKIEKKI